MQMESYQLSWFYLAIINIQQEKHNLVQGRQGIEGTRRLSSRCPSDFFKSTEYLCAYMKLINKLQIFSKMCEI